jgi:uncharacterized protein (DUF58 family)
MGAPALSSSGSRPTPSAASKRAPLVRASAVASSQRSSGNSADSLTAGEAPSGLTKLDHAVNTALLLAYVASQHDDRLALLAYDDRIRSYLPPARGRRGVLRAMHTLYNLHSEPVEPDHALALQYLAAHNLRRSLLVLFTDLADRESAAPLVAHLLRAARTHQVVCVTLRDPAVVAPTLRPPRSGPDLYEQMVAQHLLDDRAAVLATLRHQGVVTLDTDADALSPQVISTYLDLKRRARV